jgi:hypothetical protein
MPTWWVSRHWDGTFLSLWDSLIGTGERDRRGGYDGPGKFEGWKTLGSVCGGGGLGKRVRGGVGEGN